MVQAVCFDGHGEPGRLLLVIHHLVVDAVSWRIILADLASAWGAISAGHEPALEPAPVSFRTWAQSVPAREWRRPPAIDPAIDTAATARDLVLELPSEVTAPLLTSVPAAFHAGVEDVLLTALALAVQTRSPGPAIIDLESHGRADDAGLERTVGWFTAIRAVSLDAPSGDLDAALKSIKEQLRNPMPVAAIPEIGFNYLGRVGAAESADWEIAAESASVPDGFDAAMPADHLLELNAVVEDRADGPILRATWTWPQRLLTEKEVRDLAESWFTHLNAIVVHAEGPDAGGYTPSDLDLVSLSQEEIEEFEAEWA
jgi:non-ribosomal peptide synthase protein (TIGR01720 family)